MTTIPDFSKITLEGTETANGAGAPAALAAVLARVELDPGTALYLFDTSGALLARAYRDPAGAPPAGGGMTELLNRLWDGMARLLTGSAPRVEDGNGEAVAHALATGLGDAPSASRSLQDAGSGTLVLAAVPLMREGVRIGIVGVTTADTPRMSSPGPRVRFGEEAAGLRAGAEAARAAGVRAVLALTHVGLVADHRLAATVPGLAAVIGGHSHTLLSNSAGGAAGRYPIPAAGAGGIAVPIVQAGAFNRYLGRLDLDLDRDGRVLAATGDARELAFAGPRDPAVEALLARLAEPMAGIRGRVVGALAGPVSNAECRIAECALGNLVAEAMLDAARGTGATIALQNGGGLRAGMPAGAVTWGDVLAVLPFQNTLATFQLSGADMLEALENGAGQVEEGAGRFAQVAGLRYTFDLSQPPGSRVSDVMVQNGADWQPLEPDTLYGVVSNDFMRNGGDGYRVFRDRAQNAYDYGPDLADVLAEYLAENSPYQPALDGRITRR